MSSNSAPRPERRPWSLALRLALWYSASAFALVLAVSAWQYLALVRHLEREDDEWLAEKTAGVKRLLETRPDDRSALLNELASGVERSRERMFVRVESDETSGMAEILPFDAFPHPGEPISYRTRDGRVFRLQSETSANGQRIQVGMDRSDDGELLEDYRRQLSYMVGMSLLASAGGGYWLARRGIRPLTQVTETARRIGPVQLSERIPTEGLPAEVRDLAETFNGMLARLDNGFVRLARFSGDIAHELRSPVQNLRGEVEVALARPRNGAEYRETLESCLEEYDRLTRLIDSLLFLARAENPKAELHRDELDLAKELAVVQEFFEPAATEAGIRLVCVVPPSLPLFAERALFQRVMANLVNNALAHTLGGGTITIIAESADGVVRVEVSDTGEGIAAVHLPYLFDRFYRVWHVYPEGGIGAVCERLADEVRDAVRTESPVEAILVEGGRAVGVRVNGEDIPARAVVSTAPVPILAKLIRGTARLAHLARFRYRAMVFVNMRFDGPSGLPDVVTWTPGAEYPFFRLSDISLGLPWLVPTGKAQVTCDIGCRAGDETWTATDDSLGTLCLAALERIVPGLSKRFLGCRVVRTPLAYPVFLTEYEADRRRFEQGTGVEGLYSVGRNGEFAHILMEDVFWRTRRKLVGLLDSQEAAREPLLETVGAPVGQNEYGK